MSSQALSISMLVVLVIACVFLFVAVYVLHGRPPRDGTAPTERSRRRALAASLLCLVVGLALAAAPLTHLLTSLLLPGATP